MPIHLLDTSALAKRYFPEIGSRWVDHILRTETVAISEIVIVEFASVVARQHGEGHISSAQRSGILRLFRQDISDSIVVEIGRDILNDAAALLLALPRATMLRTLDAIHVVSAMRAFSDAATVGVPSGVLVSADNRLVTVAQQAGIDTDDPRLHP